MGAGRLEDHEVVTSPSDCRVAGTNPVTRGSARRASSC
jgi:hypothetical protein